MDVAEAQVGQPPAAPGSAFDPGQLLLHHMLDPHEIEIPFTDRVVHLPRIEWLGYDLSPTRSVVMMWIASAILVVLAVLAVRTRREPVPRGLRGVVEAIVLFVRDQIARESIGAQADRFAGYLVSTFLFILVCNLLGLFPALTTPTGTIGVTAGLALTAFVMIQWGGIREHGLVGHFRNLVPHGMPFWLVPILLFVELLGTFIKPFALCVRLFANMMAGHVVILAFISLIFILGSPWVAAVSVPFALFVYLLELLVAFIQAYIFTMLTAQFIGMTVHPAH
jgi:F-type H+-transporting ATPase subunit a